MRQVANRWNVFTGESVCGIGNQKACLTDSTVSHHHTFNCLHRHFCVYLEVEQEGKFVRMIELFVEKEKEREREREKRLLYRLQNVYS